jgi:iron complex outermembrane receptor protein/outer membrane receptor for ferrienterochelin and colicins
MQLKYKELEVYIGYNHTLSKRERRGADKLNEPFNPQDKIAMTLAWAVPGKWRMGVESAYTGNQYVYDNRRVRPYWFWAAMVARQFPWGMLALNCENIGDARQSRHEPLVTGSFQQPVFTPVWGAVEGRVLNLSLKIDW